MASTSIRINILLLILLHLFLTTEASNFPKLKEMLRKTLSSFPAEKEKFKNDITNAKSSMVKRLFKNGLIALSYTSTVTEYINIKSRNLDEFILHLTKTFGNLSTKAYEDIDSNIKDILYSKTNDIVISRFIAEDAVGQTRFINLIGESSADKKSSNWLALDIWSAFTLGPEYIKKDKTNTLLCGFYTSTSSELIVS